MADNRNKHEANVRKAAAFFGATVELANNGHYKIVGKGWRVFVPSTPHIDWDETRVRNHIRKGTFRAAYKRVTKGGKK